MAMVLAIVRAVTLVVALLLNGTVRTNLRDGVRITDVDAACATTATSAVIGTACLFGGPLGFAAAAALVVPWTVFEVWSAATAAGHRWLGPCANRGVTDVTDPERDGSGSNVAPTAATR
jgi:hypothetical protein